MESTMATEEQPPTMKRFVLRPDVTNWEQMTEEEKKAEASKLYKAMLRALND